MKVTDIFMVTPTVFTFLGPCEPSQLVTLLPDTFRTSQPQLWPLSPARSLCNAGSGSTAFGIGVPKGPIHQHFGDESNI